MVQYCPRCGARNAAREPLCGACGQKLYGLFGPGAPRSVCGICDAANPGSAEFCVRCGRAIGEVLGPERPLGERLTVAKPVPVPGRRERPRAPAELAPPAGRGTRLGPGCLGGIAAAVVAVLGAALVVGLVPRGVQLSLPATWRGAGAVRLVEVGEGAEPFAAGSTGFAVAAGRGGAGAFALPLATPAAAGPAGRVAAAAERAAPNGASSTATAPTARPPAGAAERKPPDAAGRVEGPEPAGTNRAGSAASAPAVPAADAAAGSVTAGIRPTAPAAAARPAAVPSEHSVPGAGGRVDRTTAGGSEQSAPNGAGPSQEVAAPEPAVAATGAPARGAGGAAGEAGTRAPSAVPTATVQVAAGEPARRGATLFAVTSVEARSDDVGRRRLEVRAALQNLGGAPLPYDAASARVEGSGGIAHAPVASVAQPLAHGLLAAGDAAVLDLSFDLSADETRLTLVYDGIAVDLGDAALRTFRSPPLPQ